MFFVTADESPRGDRGYFSESPQKGMTYPKQHDPIEYVALFLIVVVALAIIYRFFKNRAAPDDWIEEVIEMEREQRAFETAKKHKQLDTDHMISNSVLEKDNSLAIAFVLVVFVGGGFLYFFVEPIIHHIGGVAKPIFYGICFFWVLLIQPVSEWIRKKNL